MAKLHVYLTFQGNCREAMTFYHACIGGEIELNTFSESPAGAHISPEMQDYILHAKITKGDFLLMASDNGGMHPPVTIGTAVSLSLDCTSTEEITDFFAKLSAGGKVTMPLQEQFWGATFGMFTDKFGIHWMLNYDHPQH